MGFLHKGSSSGCPERLRLACTRVPGGYVPSILCYKETARDSWVEHFCLVKLDVVFDEEDSVSEAAEIHIAEARAVVDAGGSPQDFALSLRHEGYKSVSDFRVITYRGGV